MPSPREGVTSKVLDDLKRTFDLLFCDSRRGLRTSCASCFFYFAELKRKPFHYFYLFNPEVSLNVYATRPAYFDISGVKITPREENGEKPIKEHLLLTYNPGRVAKKRVTAEHGSCWDPARRAHRRRSGSIKNARAPGGPVLRSTPCCSVWMRIHERQLIARCYRRRWPQMMVWYDFCRRKKTT